MTDPQRSDRLNKMAEELYGAGIRLNQSPPDIQIEKKVSGGLEIHSNIRQDVEKETFKQVAWEFGIKNGDISIREKLTLERLFDAFSSNRVYIPAIFAVNKIDQSQNIPRKEGVVYFSAEKELGMQGLINAIWEKLKFVTVYLVEPEKDPDLSNPIIMKLGDSIKDVAIKIGNDFAAKQKLVKIWGKGAKFPGQEVSFSTNVEEGMQIRFL